MSAEIKLTAEWSGTPWWRSLEFKLENLSSNTLENPEIEFSMTGSDVLKSCTYAKNTGFEFTEDMVNGEKVIKGNLEEYLYIIKPQEIKTFSIGVAFPYEVSGTLPLPSNIKINGVAIDNDTPIDDEGDKEAPSVPTDIEVVKKSATTIELKWSPSTDNVGVTGYNIFYQDKTETETEKVKTSKTNSVTLQGLKSESEYTIYINAFDKAGNISDKSKQYVAQTSEKIDNVIEVAQFVDFTAYPTPNLKENKDSTRIDDYFLGFGVGATNIKGYYLQRDKEGKDYLLKGKDIYKDDSGGRYHVKRIDDTKGYEEENVKLFREVIDETKNIAVVEEFDIKDLVAQSSSFNLSTGLYWGGFVLIYDSIQAETCSGRVSDGEYGKKSVEYITRTRFSEGGAAGMPLAQYEKSVKNIAEEYKKILEKYQDFDFDFEGAFLANKDALARHMQAIKDAYNSNTKINAKITYTLPVDIDGFSTVGRDFVQSLKAEGIGPKEQVPASFDFMVMELREDGSIVEKSKKAADAGRDQVAKIYNMEAKEAASFIYLCPMYGKNNNGNMYNLEDHREFLNFALEGGYKGFTGWDMNRDLNNEYGKMAVEVLANGEHMSYENYNLSVVGDSN